MSAPRSRHRTVGAFGNPRAKPIGFVPKALTQRPEAPRFRIRHDVELGDKWRHFTLETGLLRGLIDHRPVQAKLAHENRQAIVGATNISQLMWNAAIRGPEGEEEAFKVISGLRHPQTKESVAPPPEECRKLIRELVDLKNRLYPDEKKQIVEYEHYFDANGIFQFRVNGQNMNPEGVIRPEGTSL